MCTCARQVPRTPLPALHGLSGHFLLLIPKRRKRQGLSSTRPLCWDSPASRGLSAPPLNYLLFSHLFSFSPSAGCFSHLQAYSGILQHIETPTHLSLPLCAAVSAPLPGQTAQDRPFPPGDPHLLCTACRLPLPGLGSGSSRDCP